MNFLISPEYCNLAGKVTKTNGKDQMVTISFDPDFDTDIDRACPLFFSIQGLLVPFYIEELRMKGSHSALVKLKNLDTDGKASQIACCEVFTDSRYCSGKRKPGNKSSVYEGYSVVDVKHGDLGIVEGFISYSGNSLLSIVKDGKEILVPLADEYIRSVNKKKKSLIIETPEGLVELNA